MAKGGFFRPAPCAVVVAVINHGTRCDSGSGLGHREQPRAAQGQKGAFTWTRRRDARLAALGCPWKPHAVTCSDLTAGFCTFSASFPGGFRRRTYLSRKWIARPRAMPIGMASRTKAWSFYDLSC